MKAQIFSLILLTALVVDPLPSLAQSFTLGADVVSRYIWRGTDFGESASIQPALSVSGGGFEMGTWASYAMNPESAYANEHDLWLSYTIGPLSVGVTDYYFPNLGAGFFDFDDHGDGAHYIEPFLSFSGSSSLPVTLFAGYFAYNDPDNSVYLNAAYPFSIEGVDLSFAVGASATESVMYGTSGFGIVDVTLAASRNVPLTESFSLPLGVAYVLNPYAEKSFLVVGLSL